jgi:tetratricopeptide (TPR) repeat protein
MSALLAAIALALASPATGPAPPSASLTGAEMLELARRAAEAGDIALAERALRILARDPDVRMRSEARFRLARLLAARGRLSEAAVLLRAVLDEQPDAQPVRLELARLLERIGDEAGARAALRQAQAGGLPPEAARHVDRWSAALRARKPAGASFEIALAPDSNINRATSASTLGTVIGDFTLDRAARQRSGLGLALRGEAYARQSIGRKVSLLGRVAGAADLYRYSRFSSQAVSLSAGPEAALGAERLTAQVEQSWQRFGGRLYARTTGASLDFLHPLDRRSQLRAGAAVAAIDNRFNPLEDGHSLSGRLGYEHALSARAGLALMFWGERRSLRDPGYSTKGGQASLTVYREAGAMTLTGAVAAGRLVADSRLLLYPRKRSDTFGRISLGAEFRQIVFAGLAPFVRLVAERNRSSIEIYDFGRIRTELGLTRAF